MVSTAHSYAAFQLRLNKILSEAQQRTPGFCGYSGADSAFRLVQRFAELGVFEFTRVAAEKYRRTGSLPTDEETLDCGGLLFVANGKIKLTLRIFMANLVGFVANWSYGFWAIFISLRLFGVRKKLSLVYGVGIQDLLAEGSDARFLSFCRDGQIAPLAASDYLVVQAAQRIVSTQHKRVKYGSNPMLVALGWSGLGLRLWFQALCQHTLAASNFVRAICICPHLVLLGKDAATHAVASALNHQGSLQNTIFTTSNYFSQPLWSWAMPERAYVSHIVWYSQNMYPISYVDETEAVPIPNLGFIKTDIQWVWSEGFRSFLEGICPPCGYRVVPSIVWHLPSKRSLKPTELRRIALFDVTPIDPALEVKLGLIRNFYNEKNISWFIRDVIDAAQEVGRQSGLKIEVVLKHKRNHHSNFHSSEYISTISKLSDEGAITLVDPAANLHDLIAISDVIVAAPYSSPVYLGIQTGKVAFWYDPTETIDWKLGAQEIMLVHGKQRLLSELLQIFG